MSFLKTCVFYLIFLTICLTTGAQITDLKTAIKTTENTGNKIGGDMAISIQRKGRDSSLQKPGIEPKPTTLNLSPNPLLKTQIPRIKSTQIPINLVVNNKPGIIPTKIPLAFKTKNVMPVPGHYVRLKAEPDKNKSSCPKANANFGCKNAPTIAKVLPKSFVAPTLSRALKAKNEKPKPKSIQFFEDTNIDSLPPAPTQPVTRKSKKPESCNDSANTEKLDDSDVVHIKNATHLIRISKIPQPAHKSSNDGNNAKKQQKCTSINLDEYKGPENEEVTVTMVINRDDNKCLGDKEDTKMYRVTAREPPKVIAHSMQKDPSECITITNHKYEEVEERPSYCEAHNIDNNPSLYTSIREAVPTNTGNIYPQSYQAAYDQYLKYMAEANPILCRKSNCYPHVPPPEDTSDYPLAFTLNESSDCYGVKPETMSVVDVNPDNNLGRIWRTWKDTEVKISKPNLLNNKPSDCGRVYSDYNYGSRPMYGSQPCVFNGYYDNLNNAVPYPYSYQSYRYMM